MENLFRKKPEDRKKDPEELGLERNPVTGVYEEKKTPAEKAEEFENADRNNP